MEDAFSTLLRRPISLVGAGRTDAGVHARQMFAHFDVDDFVPDSMIRRLNAYLPKDIAVERIFKVPFKAHARFDALSRTYTYWVLQQKDPFYQHSAHYVKHPLDIENMNRAAQLILKHRDFECFSKSHTDVKTYFCEVTESQWQWDGEKLIFTITADRFLRNMVRAIVGTLIQVGMGLWDMDRVNSILKSGDRGMAGPSVPAKGLYLAAIGYPKTIVNPHG